MNWDCDRNREHQPFVAELINVFAPNGIGVEIGVNEGQLSYYLLKNTNLKHLYLIDPWITWKGWASQEILEKRYKFCNEELPETFPNRVTTIRKTSADASSTLNDTLDFIFIDGNHDYEYVKQDLELWIPKVKSQGLVAGHDWSHAHQGVPRAVQDYYHDHKDDFIPYISDYSSKNLKLRYQPAPGINPVVNKSKRGKVWWTLKS